MAGVLRTPRTERITDTGLLHLDNVCTKFTKERSNARPSKEGAQVQDADAF
jgi:hypothetical protein